MNKSRQGSRVKNSVPQRDPSRPIQSFKVPMHKEHKEQNIRIGVNNPFSYVNKENIPQTNNKDCIVSRRNAITFTTCEKITDRVLMNTFYTNLRRLEPLLDRMDAIRANVNIPESIISPEKPT